ncbi:hypothetical protein MHU86_4347 [Fragilaria crotonensis]|nr:hypothetical protein MHU86_4347 [Fragilaria crotonensis]
MGKGGYGEPDWATPGASAMAGTTQETGVPAPSGGIVNAATPRDSSSVILSILSVCNVALSVMMAALGVLTL